MRRCLLPSRPAAPDGRYSRSAPGALSTRWKPWTPGWEARLSAHSFSTSPHNLLDGADFPPFGYFNRERTQTLHTRLQGIPPGVKESFCADERSAIGEVLHAFEVTAAEAARRGYAVAVVHS